MDNLSTEFKVDEFKAEAVNRGYDSRVVDNFLEKRSNPSSLGESSPLNTSESGSIMQSMTGTPGVGGYKVTQPFGNKSSIEKYSGGINLGADVATPANTQLRVPPGEWTVIKASPGFNNGSGNFLLLRNQQGETVGYEHLSQINLQPGQTVSGGDIAGLSGGSQGGAGQGNSTGNHSSLIYKTPNGSYADILATPYAQYILGGK